MSDLQSLGEVCGVDFSALRTKYENIQKSESEKIKDKADAVKAFEKLDKYSYCKSCGGLGIVKYIYNHMVLEQTCEKCEGEGIVQQLEDNVKAIESSLLSKDNSS